VLRTSPPGLEGPRNPTCLTSAFMCNRVGEFPLCSKLSCGDVACARPSQIFFCGAEKACTRPCGAWEAFGHVERAPRAPSRQEAEKDGDKDPAMSAGLNAASAGSSERSLPYAAAPNSMRTCSGALSEAQWAAREALSPTNTVWPPPGFGLHQVAANASQHCLFKPAALSAKLPVSSRHAVFGLSAPSEVGGIPSVRSSPDLWLYSLALAHGVDSADKDESRSPTTSLPCDVQADDAGMEQCFAQRWTAASSKLVRKPDVAG